MGRFHSPRAANGPDGPGMLNSPTGQSAAASAAQSNPFGRFASPERGAPVGPGLRGAFGTPDGERRRLRNLLLGVMDGSDPNRHQEPASRRRSTEGDGLMRVRRTREGTSMDRHPLQGHRRDHHLDSAQCRQADRWGVGCPTRCTARAWYTKCYGNLRSKLLSTRPRRRPYWLKWPQLRTSNIGP